MSKMASLRTFKVGDVGLILTFDDHYHKPAFLNWAIVGENLTNGLLYNCNFSYG